MTSSSRLRLSVIIPALNEEAILLSTLSRWVSRLSSWPGSTVFVVDNGSTDRTLEVAEEFARGLDGDDVRVKAVSIHDRGIGFAYHRGIEEALSETWAVAEVPIDHWILLSAADLPFEFTDLEQFLAARERAGHPSFLAIGSKAHPESRIRRSLLRRTLGLGFRGLSRVLIGLKTRDPQGTFFVPERLAGTLNQRTRARNFFFSTELTYHAERLGARVVEMPIQLSPEIRPSTVRPIKDSVAMIRSMRDLIRRESARRTDGKRI